MPTMTLEAPYLYLPLSYRPSLISCALARQILERLDEQTPAQPANEPTKKTA